MTGQCSGQTVRDLASGDKSSRALPATPCRPTQGGRNILDQQQDSTHNPRSIVSFTVTRGVQDST
jgi:hypothetical protein